MRMYLIVPWGLVHEAQRLLYTRRGQIHASPFHWLRGKEAYVAYRTPPITMALSRMTSPGHLQAFVLEDLGCLTRLVSS